MVFSGSEDLGGGLKANFVLQQRFNPTNGNNDGTFAGRRTFQGASTVGLSGGFGSVRLGREIEAYNDVNNWADPWGTVRSASVAAGISLGSIVTGGNAGLGPDASDLGRVNGIHYNTPSFGGLTVGITYGFKDQTDPQWGGSPAGTEAHISANAVYAAGPLTVMAGLMQNRYDDEALVVGVGYNFGFADVKFAMHDIDGVAGGSIANTDKYKAYQIGVNVPMGATVFSLGYINDKVNNGSRSNKLGLGAQYNLSKRTALIATYGKRKSTKANFDFSVRHTF